MNKVLTFILFIAIVLTVSNSVFSQSSDIENIKKVLSQTDLSEIDRFYMAATEIGHESVSRQIYLFRTIMHDYCLGINDKELSNRLLARNHLFMAICYATEQNRKEELLQYDSAMMYISETKTESFEMALTYRRYADSQIQSGSIENGHTYYWKAIKIYEKIKGNEVEISYCYYQLATGYLQKGDIEGIRNVVGQMKSLAGSCNDRRISYDYYSVCSVYYAMLLQEQPDSSQWRDSIEYFNLKSIAIIEPMTRAEMLDAQIKPVWNYYNHALFFDPDDGEPVIDSIEKYIDKAEKAVEKMEYKGWERDECYISILDERAWLHYYKEEYGLAEKQMLEVVALLDKVDQYTPNTVLMEREQAYRFLADLYEETGRIELALEYQKLIGEVANTRFNIETQNTLNQLMIQYEVDKKQNEILHLRDENRSAQKVFWLTTGLLVLIIVIIVIAFEIFRLRKINLSIKLYEKELENEIILQELSFQTKQKTLLTKEYERLKLIVSKNEVEAEKYKSDLEDIQRQLNESHSKVLKASMADTISQSKSIAKDDKQKYTALLENINTENLDSLFSSATTKLTSLDTKYILCFMIDMKTEHIADLFSISIDSVYSVRHRVRKKFDKKASLPF